MQEGLGRFPNIHQTDGLAASDGTHKIKVLIVEDNPGDARLVEVMLGQVSIDYAIKFEFLKSQTLSEALAVIDEYGENHLDVILLDLGLPDSSGVSTVEKMVDKTSSVPVIAYNGMDDIHVGLEAMRVGAASYIVKGESTPATLAKNILFVLEQHKLKKQPENERNKMQMLVDELPSMVCIKDKDGKIIFANNAMSSFIGVPVQELLGKTAYDLMPEEEAKKVLANEEFFVKSGVEQTLEESVTKTLMSAKKQLILEDGSAGLLLVITDITDRYESRRKSVLLRKFFDNTNEGMTITDKDGIITVVNPAFSRITGYLPDEAIGQNPRLLQSGRQSKEFYEKMWQDILETGRWEGEIYNKRKNGEIYPEWLTITQILDDNGNVEHFVAVFLDLTQLRERQHKIDEQAQMLITQSRFAAMGEMIGMIAHQWRQPITAIGMAANNMMLDVDMDDIDADTFRKHLGSIDHQVQFLSHTIDDFRNFFKPDREVSRISISGLIDGALKIIGKSLENNAIEVRQEISYDPKIEAYESELVQALLAIITNAKDVMLERRAQNPTITLISMQNPEFEESVELHICDNGGGVPEELTTKIFEPYFSTKAKNGTGLGLYIAKTIIEKHQKGSIGVRNENGGACFWIRLPIEHTNTSNKEAV